LRHDAQLAVNALFRLEYKLREEQQDHFTIVTHADLDDDILETMRQIDREFDKL
jgi:hypothetical protein